MAEILTLSKDVDMSPAFLLKTIVNANTPEEARVHLEQLIELRKHYEGCQKLSEGIEGYEDLDEISRLGNLIYVVAQNPTQRLTMERLAEDLEIFFDIDPSDSIDALKIELWATGRLSLDVNRNIILSRQNG